MKISTEEAGHLLNSEVCDTLIKNILATARCLHDCTHVYALVLHSFMEPMGPKTHSVDVLGVSIKKNLSDSDTEILPVLKDEDLKMVTTPSGLPLMIDRNKTIKDYDKIPGPAYTKDIPRPPMPKRPDE